MEISFQGKGGEFLGLRVVNSQDTRVVVGVVDASNTMLRGLEV